MTPAAIAAVYTHTGIRLDPQDDTILCCAVLRRYADDCRFIMSFNRDSDKGRRTASFFIDLYRTQCYAKPCVLDDEERGESFHFMQGIYRFLPACNTVYFVKNAVTLLTFGRGQLRTLQHYYSYGPNPHQLRLATIMGKLTEIDCMCSTELAMFCTLSLLVLELVSLSYPKSIIRKCLHRKHSRSSDRFWIKCIPALMEVYDLSSILLNKVGHVS